MSSQLEPSQSGHVRSTANTETSQETGPSQEAVFEILSNERRRYVLHALRKRQSPIKLGQLAEQVAAWENNTDISDITYNQRKRVYSALQQSHLPKMERAGAIEFDKDRGTIVPSDDLSKFDIYLEVVPNTRRPHTQYYLGLATFGTTVVFLAAFDVGPFAFVADIMWALLVTVLFGSAAVLDLQTARDKKIEPEVNGDR